MANTAAHRAAVLAAERKAKKLAEPGDPADHMADLRWALLNSHEFRYLP